MSHDEYDFFDEITEAQFLEDKLKDISEEGVRSYLGTYGDAVDQRIANFLAQAEQLKDAGWCDASVVMSVTAIELTVRFLLVRPLIGAAFLSEDWADLLSQRIVTSRTVDDRKLLPEILRFHDIDIKRIQLKDQRELWPVVLKIYEMRNRIVHAGESATVKHAETAIECAKELREQAVLPLAKKHGFTLEATGKWHRIKKGIIMRTGYSPRSPFK